VSPSNRIGNGLRTASSVAATVEQMRLSASVLYLLSLLTAALRTSPPPPSADPEARILVLVPAHNEEADVAAAVWSLISQDHPKHMYEVIVIADNCDDATAAVARSAGATVWERQDAERRGKGAALSWALGRLEHERPQTDAMVFVDADCQASPNLVSALAGALRQGADAAQSRYLVSNADESSQAALRAAGFSLKHIVRARGRAGLGLSPGLFGTGMAFVAELMHDSTWSESVTEDTELFLRLIETGRSIAYVEHATVSSPAPLTSRDAEDQQLRWETGNRQLLRARLSRLLYRGLGERNREMLGAAAELALPAQSTIVTGQSGVILIAMLTRRRRLLQVSVATLAGEVVYVAGGLILVGGTASLLKALRHLPRFLILRVRILATVSAGGGARSWDRTKRSSG
jgi:cellulose synthase/poly-beta-1,6-N-acetylglucosamine synthase-like glycosyltransferase